METSPYAEMDTSPANLGETVYRDLKAQLLLGDFLLNQRMGEGKIASTMNVSRTPVREALQRLATEGLLERHPEGGWRPAVPDVQRVRELYEIRRSLELCAIRRPSELGLTHPVSLLEPLRDEWRALAVAEQVPDPEFVILEESFHVRLAESAGNLLLVEMLSQVNERIRAVRKTDFLSRERVNQAISQHLGIVETLLVGDARGAETRLAHHIKESMAIIEEGVTLALARMAGFR